jgi:hypothetical protein
MPDVVNVRHCLARSQPGQDKKFALLHFKKLAPDTGKKYLQPTTTTNGVNDLSCRSAISSETSIPIYSIDTLFINLHYRAKTYCYPIYYCRHSNYTLK